MELVINRLGSNYVELVINRQQAPEVRAWLCWWLPWDNACQGSLAGTLCLHPEPLQGGQEERGCWIPGHLIMVKVFSQSDHHTRLGVINVLMY